MKRSIVTTKDGSKTIRLEEWNEHYHSTHGALQESMHVYIRAGLDHFLTKYQPDEISVLEAGFGTGLNALLAQEWSEKTKTHIHYTGVEAFPISEEERHALDYSEVMPAANAEDIFHQLHEARWEEVVPLTEHFKMIKHQLFFAEMEMKNVADVVFYDAFGPRVQPELWEVPVFQKFYEALKPGGVFVTYCVKGTAKRAMQSIGFEVDIIEGPPGKRHMMRASKPC